MKSEKIEMERVLRPVPLAQRQIGPARVGRNGLLSSEVPGLSGVRYDLADYINPDAIGAATGQRFDSDTAFFLRDLTEVMGRTFDRKYPELTARQIFPVFTGVDPAAESYLWRSFDFKGSAALIDDYSSDQPSVEVVAGEYTSRCYSLGVSYNYSIMDLRRARMAGIPLETRKAYAARRAMENAFEQIAYFGVAQNPSTAAGAQSLQFVPTVPNSNDPIAAYGVCNFPAISTLSLVQSTTNTWTNAAQSIDTIVSDFNKMVVQVFNQSLGVHEANCVVFPRSTLAFLKQKPQSTTFRENSILELLLALNPNIKNVYWSNMLEGAGKMQDGSTPGPRILCFERNEENMQLVVPQEFEQLPPQMVNMSFKIPCHMRVGGIRVSYPLAFTFLDGTAG